MPTVQGKATPEKVTGEGTTSAAQGGKASGLSLNDSVTKGDSERTAAEQTPPAGSDTVLPPREAFRCRL